MDERVDFTIDPVNFAGLPEYVDQLKREGVHFTIILDPALITNVSGYEPYQRGTEQDVWIKWPTGTSPDEEETGNDYMLGYVWPRGKVVFPDFLKASTQQWWQDEIVKYYKETLKFDALWIKLHKKKVLQSFFKFHNVDRHHKLFQTLANSEFAKVCKQKFGEVC
ncbi:PREDICTED: sucrase-isomaltase, intestinal-like [Priapulus caudatus]|uniref:Sucrase-isomaltase, intestinal-like n=1 Tax=Priapulus caudatus TaxID=37621 RepID=A0ABM1DYH9_PRICU|nr:PREDICTED: sucrase-isomaltase, intestinal-like [Priapulus caudatus]